MKKTFCWTLLFVVLSIFSGIQSMAADKVVVIPLMKSAFAGAQYHTVSFADFMPREENTDYTHGWLLASLGYLKLSTGGISIFNAPVNLPDGVILSEVTLAAADEGNGATIDVWLQKFNITTNTFGFIPDQAPLSTSTLSQDEYALQSRTVNEIIDNENYQYFINAAFQGGNSDRLYAVRLKFTYK